MSFSGDLEHLSIIDVVQLMHSGRKSGTLTIRGRQRECQLVFNEGFIVSANHCDNDVRIGRILVDAKVITEETLERSLREQKSADPPRKPLIALLIEGGSVKKETAYRGLETLIQLTIVEVLTWRRGTFSLDPDKVLVTDEYRYFPEQLHQEVQFNTQFLLMNALRIYDEKKRDGVLKDEETDKLGRAGEGAGGETGATTISADDLGLGEVDRLERRIPEVYLGLEDHSPDSSPRPRLRLPPSELTEAERTALERFLDTLPARAATAETSSLPVVLYSADPLMTSCLNTVCKREGLHVFATNEENDLGPIIDQFLVKHGMPVLVLDTPSDAEPGFTPENLSDLRRRQKKRYPHLCVIQLASPFDPDIFNLTPEEGAVTIMCRPLRVVGSASFADDAIRFLGAFPSNLKAHAWRQGGWLIAKMRESLRELRDQREPPDIAAALLRAAAATFTRVLTLMVRGHELIAEKGIGIKAEQEREPAQVSGVRIPLGQTSLLHEIIRTGRAHIGRPDDPALQEWLYNQIGAPLHPAVLLLPLQVQGRTISLIYADFGQEEAPSLRVEPWEILAAQAGLVLENVLHRKRLETPSA